MKNRRDEPIGDSTVQSQVKFEISAIVKFCSVKRNTIVQGQFTRLDELETVCKRLGVNINWLFIIRRKEEDGFRCFAISNQTGS